MFKWTCLAVATAGLVAFLWMVNDMRLEVNRVGKMVEKHLPPILENAQDASVSVKERLPVILEETEKSVTTLAELTEDVRQFKELFGDMQDAKQNPKLAKHATSVLNLIDSQQEAAIGLEPTEEGGDVKSPVPAQQWVKSARRDARFLNLITRSPGELMERLTTSKSGAPLYIQLANEAPKKLLDWVMKHQPPAKDPP